MVKFQSSGRRETQWSRVEARWIRRRQLLDNQSQLGKVASR